jgi:hypothetical protein
MLSGMRIARRTVLAGLALVCALAAAAGCLGPRLPAGQPAFVYIAANGVVSFAGEPILLADLPKRLRRAGADGQTSVQLIAQGAVSDRILKSIASSLSRDGFRRVMILNNEKRASAQVAGKPLPAAE